MEEIKGKEVKVLDHGYVKYIGHLGGDEDIIEAARMSTGKGFISWDGYDICESCGKVWHYNQEQKSDHLFCPGIKKAYPRGDTGLLEHLYKNKHMTPFEMCDLVIEVQAPIFVFREWHRHRTQSYNEFSARYSVMPNLHYAPEENRLIPKKTSNKQEMSIGYDSLLCANSPLTADILQTLEEQQRDLYSYYEVILGKGVPKEVARLNTPVSRYSKMRAKANLRNWLGFLMLRKASDAQWEIRQYADVVGDIIKELWPRTYELFLEYDFEGVRLSRDERLMLSLIFRDISDSEKLHISKQANLIDDKTWQGLIKKLNG